jgi:hypothetical protein
MQVIIGTVHSSDGGYEHLGAMNTHAHGAAAKTDYIWRVITAGQHVNQLLLSAAFARWSSVPASEQTQLQTLSVLLA